MNILQNGFEIQYSTQMIWGFCILAVAVAPIIVAAVLKSFYTTSITVTSLSALAVFTLIAGNSPVLVAPVVFSIAAVVWLALLFLATKRPNVTLML